MKFDKGELFISIVWLLTICFAFWVMYKNVDLQSEIGSLNREIHELHKEYCPQINYDSEDCKEYKEMEDSFKEIENETEEEFRKRVFKHK